MLKLMADAPARFRLAVTAVAILANTALAVVSVSVYFMCVCVCVCVCVSVCVCLLLFPSLARFSLKLVVAHVFIVCAGVQALLFQLQLMWIGAHPLLSPHM